jgi:hypothetical protein
VFKYNEKTILEYSRMAFISKPRIKASEKSNFSEHLDLGHPASSTVRK